MAVIRQQSWQGQQRVDVPHLRSLESGVAHDFDILAGQMIAGKLPTVVSGFTVLLNGAIGNDAEALKFRVAGAELINFNATEAGSIFRVPDNRADETLSPTNSKIQGSFTPNSTNFLGVDLIRSVDDSTADTVQFLNPTTDKEQPKIVPLARTMDYKIVISTTEFSATPGLAPIVKVVTDASNKVLTITDARWLLFRLGSGGSNPLAVNPFPWPGGRNESNATLASVAGDRSIFSLKDWLNAAMTRMWEIGGGEFWYSLTADRNVRMVQTGTFPSTGMSFEWVGTPKNLHWKGIKFLFDNSTGSINEVQDQLTNSAGLTNLADGECVYADLDRTQDRTVAGANPLIAQKAVLRTLGGSTRPGQRYVMAWRNGNSIYIRDQNFAVGSSFVLATTATAGTLWTTIDPAGGWDVTDPVAAGVAMLASASYTATAGGLSHNLDVGTGWLLAANDIIIGRGTAAGDQNIIITTADNSYNTEIHGTQDYAAGGLAAGRIFQHFVGAGHHILDLVGHPVTLQVSHFFESGGAIGIRNTPSTPATPAPTASNPARMKFYARTNGVASPNTKDQVCVMWFDGSITVIAESPTY